MINETNWVAFYGWAGIVTFGLMMAIRVYRLLRGADHFIPEPEPLLRTFIGDGTAVIVMLLLGVCIIAWPAVWFVLVMRFDPK